MKRKDIFILAYIVFIFLSAIIRQFIDFPMWNKIVVAVTAVSWMIALSDGLLEISSLSKSTADLIPTVEEQKKKANRLLVAFDCDPASADITKDTLKNTLKRYDAIKKEMVTKADLVQVIQDFTDPQTRREYLILNGESVEANLAYSSIYKTAKKSVFVIDNYIGLKTLVLLKNVTTSVRITVFSDNIGHGLHQSDYDDFHGQYPLIQFDFRKTCGVYHDRYIVIDYGRKTEKIYHCGASSKDAGKKVTTITQVTDRQVYHPLVDALLLNPVLLLN
jgi:hypothetical protein